MINNNATIHTNTNYIYEIMYVMYIYIYIYNTIFHKYNYSISILIFMLGPDRSSVAVSSVLRLKLPEPELSYTSYNTTASITIVIV